MSGSVNPPIQREVLYDSFHLVLSFQSFYQLRVPRQDRLGVHSLHRIVILLYNDKIERLAQIKIPQEVGEPPLGQGMSLSVNHEGQDYTETSRAPPVRKKVDA